MPLATGRCFSVCDSLDRVCPDAVANAQDQDHKTVLFKFSLQPRQQQSKPSPFEPSPFEPSPFARSAPPSNVSVNWKNSRGSNCGPAVHRGDEELIEPPSSQRSLRRVSESSHNVDRQQTWRAESEERRSRAHSDAVLIRNVVKWGREDATALDLHTGEPRPITIQLRGDSKVLEVFDRTMFPQMRIYPCPHIDRCVEFKHAQEVIARRFFLRLREVDMNRGLLITMDRQLHVSHVAHQGRFCKVPTQVCFLLKNSLRRKEFSDAICALTRLSSQPMDHRPYLAETAFRQVPEAFFAVEENFGLVEKEAACQVTDQSASTQEYSESCCAGPGL